MHWHGKLSVSGTVVANISSQGWEGSRGKPSCSKNNTHRCRRWELGVPEGIGRLFLERLPDALENIDSPGMAGPQGIQ